jgi:4-hydroxy-2-oxoglutarate aldolase
MLIFSAGMTVRLDGIFPPMPTVFDASGRVDAKAIRANVKFWMGTDLIGVLALGSNGEAPMLDDDECVEVVQAARAEMPAGKTLIAGTGRESTKQTIEAGKRAAAAGADAVLVRTPFFFKGSMTPDALLAHYRGVADASPVPVLLYNMPGVTGVTLTPAIVEKLSAHPNIVGIKETSVELERLGQFAAAAPKGFTVLCGAAPVIYPALVSGAGGGILAAACVVPDLCTKIFSLARAGQHADALKLQQRITPFARLVTTVHSIAGLRAAMEIAGHHGGAPRLPMQPLSANARKEIEECLHSLTQKSSS